MLAAIRRPWEGATHSSFLAQDQRWRRHSRQQLDDVDVQAGFHDARRHVGGDRAAAEVGEPAQLLIAPSRDEAGSEKLPIDRVVLSPTQARQCNDRAIALLRFAIASHRSSLRVRAVENQVRDMLWVSGRVPDGGGAALGHAEQHERFTRLSDLDDSLQVLDRPMARPLRRPIGSYRNRARRSE